MISKQKRSRRSKRRRLKFVDVDLASTLYNQRPPTSPPSSHHLYLTYPLPYHLRFLQSDLFNLASLAPRSLSLSRSSVRAINSARSIHTTTTVVSARPQAQRTLVTIGSRQNALNIITPSRRLDQVSLQLSFRPRSCFQLDSIRRG